MPPTSKQSREVLLETPQAQYPTLLYANVLGVEKILGNQMLHVSYQHPSTGELLAGFVCVIDGITIQEERAKWLAYLKATGYPKSEQPNTFRLPAEKITSVACCNLVLLTRVGDSAEIRLLNYSVGDVVNLRKALDEPHSGKKPVEQPKVRTQPVALIRCSLDLQRQMIIAMYDEVI